MDAQVVGAAGPSVPKPTRPLEAPVVPYIDIPALHLTDSIALHPFGFLVGCAIIVGTVVLGKRTVQLGLDERVSADIALWAVVPGFIGAHLFQVFFYRDWQTVLAEDPMLLIRFWDGIASFGGFLGGAGGVLFYLKRNKIPAWPYADAIVYAFTIAWIFGRAGCTVAHDHPGIATDFFLAVNFPEGNRHGIPAGTHHDLGFYEFLWALAMSAFFFLNRHKSRFAGWHVAAVLVAYTPVRFVFDFLRTADDTYLGFTPGQYTAVFLFAVGVRTLIVRRNSDDMLIPDGKPHIFPDGTPAIAPPPRAASSGGGKKGQKGKKAKA